MQKILILSGSFVLCVLLSGCIATTAAWEHYDECSLEHKSFVKMVECGKDRRNAYCAPTNNCSASGNSIVQYADSLVASVKAKEITEEEARRKWIEFKTNEENELSRRISSSSSSVRTPVSCQTIGNYTQCF